MNTSSIQMQNLDNDYDERRDSDNTSSICHWKGVTSAYLSAILFFVGYLILMLLHLGVVGDTSEVAEKWTGGELQTRDAMLEKYDGTKELVKIHSIEPVLYASDHVLNKWQKRLDNRSWMLLANFLCMFAWFSLVPPIFALCRSLGGFRKSREIAIAVCFVFGCGAVAVQLLMNLSMTNQADEIASKLFNNKTHSQMSGLEEDHAWFGQENSLNDSAAWTALEIGYDLLEANTAWIFALDNFALICGFGCCIHAAFHSQQRSCANKLFIVLSCIGCITCFGTFLMDIFRYTTDQEHGWFAVGKLFEGVLVLPLWLITLGSLLAKAKNWRSNGGGAYDLENVPLSGAV